MPPLTCIDLFCGCGGFTLGLLRSGIQVLAAIDFDAHALATFRDNLVERSPTGLPAVPHVLNADLTRFDPADLAAVIGVSQLDLIVGGPPCQGFSIARHVDGTNSGKRLKRDARRYLYRNFLEYVDYFQPRAFIMENVLGIRSAVGGRYFTNVQKESRQLGHKRGLPGYRVHAQVEDARALGIPQKRRRQLVIGIRNDLIGYFPTVLTRPRRASVNATLWDAIGDLPALRAGQGQNQRSYDFSRRESCSGRALSYLRDIAETDSSSILMNHVARPHSPRDLRDFKRLREGETSAMALRRGVRFEFPYSRDHFSDRYTKQSRNGPCSTIVAHLSKDGLMFIHPTQQRSLTPREAARVQGFPDWFKFPEARTHSFRLIGNSVPPVVSEAIGITVNDFLLQAETIDRGREKRTKQFGQEFRKRADAAMILRQYAELRPGHIRRVPRHDFLQAWHAMLFLFPELHPGNALDHGEPFESFRVDCSDVPGLDEIGAVRFARSGWPVALRAMGEEAWRRYEQGILTHEEFFCIAAQQAGLKNAKAVR